jgi:flagellar protein FlgJ
MLSAMRNSISRSNLTGDQNKFARDMYEDMLYDELTVSMTKNAGFGLADQIYLELNRGIAGS